ncbi:MAG: flagellar biosynthetic protein FliR [bacterium]
MDFNALSTMLPNLVTGAACVLFRLLAVFVVGIPFGYHSAVPMRIKVFLVLHISAVMVFALGFPSIDPGPGGPVAWLAVIAPEIVLGLSMGLIVRMVLWTAEGLGTMVAMSIGLGFAQSIDPGTGVQSTSLGKIANITAILLMISVDAHLQVIAALFGSFSRYPPGNIPNMTQATLEIANLGGDFIAMSLRLAAPVVACGLVIYLVLAVISRVAPQLNLFAIGLPMLIMGGLAAFGLSLPDIVTLWTSEFASIGEKLVGFLVSGRVT